MAGIDDLKHWMERDLEGEAARRHWKIEVAEANAYLLTCRVFTDSYVHSIHANTVEDYLGCTCQTRRNAPGTNHPLFADLPDGKLTEATWQSILAEIKRMEIQPFQGPSL